MKKLVNDKLYQNPIHFGVIVSASEVKSTVK